MTTLKSYCKATLYTSYCPPSTNPYSQRLKLKTLGQSSMSIESVKNGEEPKRKNFRYERVNNTFKLVQIKSHHDSDHKQQGNQDQNKMEKLSQNLQQLANRVLALEFQQAKLPAIQNKILTVSSHCNSLNEQLAYFGDKVGLVNREIGEVRERLEEVEQQEAAYQRQLSQLYTQIGILRQESERSNNDHKAKIEYIVKNLKTDLSREIGDMKENICPNLKKTFKLNSLESMVTRTSIQLNDDDDEEIEYSQFPKSQSKLQQISPHSQKKLKYRQTYHMEEGAFCINEICYKIDGMGRLLDELGFVILDSNNREIRLEQEHIKKLRDFGLIL